MANSKLLKEAIADAKAVKETALANAKIALEEAFTPRLQSILSQKMRAEAEEQEVKDDEMKNEELDSTGIGSKVDAGYAETPGAQPNLDAMTDLSVGVKQDSGKPEQAGTDYKKVADISEEENPFADKKDDKDAEIAELKARLAELEGEEDSEEEMGDEEEMDMDDMGMDFEDSMDMDSDDEESKDDMDLEAIIRELEAQLEGEDSDEEESSMYEAEDGDDEKEAKNEEADETDKEKEATNEEADDEKKDDVIDLEEILREMEKDMKDDEDVVKEEEDKEEMEKELNEAYKTIKSLQKTINEVNLLNAKLLFANKLFRAHNMTNEQKVKVIETLDRTNSVREVKLVYSTLAENFKYTSNKSTKKSISEGIASKVTKSTKPAAAKQVIAESTNFSDRFKKLAGIIK
jgi:hypothetical protein